MSAGTGMSTVEIHPRVGIGRRPFAHAMYGVERRTVAHMLYTAWLFLIPGMGRKGEQRDLHLLWSRLEFGLKGVSSQIEGTY